MEKITIGKLAQMAGVGVETVRFYQRKELLREPKLSHGLTNEEDILAHYRRVRDEIKNFAKNIETYL